MIIHANLLFATSSQPADSIVRKKTFKEKISGIVKSYKEFAAIDTNYIEPQRYHFTVQLLNSNTYESYTLKTKDNKSIVFQPKPSYKLGPYIGYNTWVIGYAIDFSHLNERVKQTDFNISFYSNLFGGDIFWRNTGSGYRIKRANLGPGIDAQPLKHLSFEGISASIKGVNLYYIFNHKRFSYPAALDMNTRQKKSCGSPLVGFGYTRHKLKLDMEMLCDLLRENIDNIDEVISDETFQSNVEVKYSDYSVSGGYAYNWVFAPCWLLSSSLSMAVGYKHTTADVYNAHESYRDFSFKNFNIDGVIRFGLVWNNARWYAGASAVFHTYNYRCPQFSTNSFFGKINMYVGFNFLRYKSR